MFINRHIEKASNLPDIKRGEGGIICLSSNLLPLKDNDKIIPVWAI